MMTHTERFEALFERRYGVSDPPPDDEWPIGNVLDFHSTAGLRVSHRDALGYAPVYGAISDIAKHIARLPLKTFRVEFDEKTGRERRLEERRSPAYRVLCRAPNDFMTPFDLMMWIATTYCLYSNCYLWVKRDKTGQAVELLPLSSSRTTLELLSSLGHYYYVTSLEGLEETGGFFAINRADVIHFHGLSLDGISGLDTIGLAKTSIATGLATTEFANRSFTKGNHSNLAVIHPGKLKGDAANNLRSSIRKRATGWENMHEPLVFEEGLAIQQLNAENRAAQVQELQQEGIRTVANWWNSSPSRLGDASKTSFASLEEANRAHFEAAVEPLLVNFEQKFEKHLVGVRRAGTITIKFDRSRSRLTTEKDRAEADSKLVERSIITPDEARAARELDPLPDDLGSKPLRMSTLVVAGEEPEPAEPPAPEPAEPPADELPDDDDDAQGDDDDERSALRHLLVETVAAIAKRVGDGARKAARSGAPAFLDYSEDLLARELATSTRRLGAESRARIVLDHFAGALAEAGGVPERALETGVESAITAIQNTVGDLADRLIEEM
jgi:HK97 family phage portal protein